MTRALAFVCWCCLAACIHAGQVCKPAPGFLQAEGRSVTLEPLTLSLDKWNAEKKTYFPQGVLSAQTIREQEFGPMTHGALVLSNDVKARNRDSVTAEEFAEDLPPVFFTATFNDKNYLLDSINASAAPLGSAKLNSPWTANLKMTGWAVAPSTLYPVNKKDENGDEQLDGFLMACGNPFLMDMGNHTMELDFGGITFMNSEGCTKLYPVKPDPAAMTGTVTNTVMCHEGTGMCFFSVWKFYDSSGPMYPDCLHYCRPDDLSHPTKCVASGVVTDVDGNQICREYKLGGGVHGFTVGHTDPTNPNAFDLLLIFTEGAGYDKGVSWISKLGVVVSDTGNTVDVVTQQMWGESLWNDTVTKPRDVGCDHAHVDEFGKVWVSTFRKGNAGLHMLDYETGMLEYSIHGFTDYVSGEYSYPAGVSGYGTMFQNNSMMAMATSSMIGGLPIAGTGSVFLIDTSVLITEA